MIGNIFRDFVLKHDISIDVSWIKIPKPPYRSKHWKCSRALVAAPYLYDVCLDLWENITRKYPELCRFSVPKNDIDLP